MEYHHCIFLPRYIDSDMYRKGTWRLYTDGTCTVVTIDIITVSRIYDDIA